MKIFTEKSLSDFEPWSGAVQTYERVYNCGKLDELESLIEEMNPDGIGETELNDLLWFEPEWIYEMLGMRTLDEINEELQEAREELESIESEFDEYSSAIQEEYADKDEDFITSMINDAYFNDFSVRMKPFKDTIRELEEEKRGY